MQYRYMSSPIGELLLAGDANSLQVLGFPAGKMQRRAEPEWQHEPAAFTSVVTQLSAYFAGELQTFDLPLQPQVTSFQASVLAELQKIPYGETTTYAAIAQRLGKPKAARAVGMANGRNPIPIIIPCHRVIGANGSLTGFGGGIETKQTLLKLEQSQQGISCI